MNYSTLKPAYYLSILIAVIAAIVSSGGLFIPGLYREKASLIAAFRGNDLVTLVVAVPLLVWALFFSRRGLQKAFLVWMGLLVYIIYNYVFYLYGVVFNPFFLLYVALIPMSVSALILALPTIDTKTIRSKFTSRTPTTFISAWMLFFALLLGGLWVMMSLGAILSGTIPTDCVKTGHPTCMVYATDLSILIPGLLVSAFLLLKRKAWGFVMTAMMLVKATTYGLVLLVMSVFAQIETGSGDPFILLWSFLTLGCLVAIWFLFNNFKEKLK